MNPDIDVAEEVLVDRTSNVDHTAITSESKEVSCQTVTGGPKDSIDNNQ